MQPKPLPLSIHCQQLRFFNEYPHSGIESVILITVIGTVVLLHLADLLRLAVLAVYLVEVLALPLHVVLKLVALLPRVVEGGLLGQVVEVGEQSVEVAVYLFLLILDLLVFGLSLAA